MKEEQKNLLDENKRLKLTLFTINENLEEMELEELDREVNL